MSTQLTRRQMLKVSGAAAVGGLLAGCCAPATTAPTQAPQATKAPQAEAPQPTTEPVVTTPEGHVVAMHFQDEMTEDLVNAFSAEYPGITLEVVQDDPTRYFAMYAAGTPPDLKRVQAPFIPQALARNMLYDLTPYFEVSQLLSLDDLAPANNYYRATDPLHVGEGPIYGMCKDYSLECSIFAYRKAFTDAGVEVPSDTEALSYQEIAELAAQLARFEGDRMVMCGYAYAAEWVDRFMMNMLAETGDSLYTEDMSQIVITGNEAAYAVCQYYYDLAANNLTYSETNPSPSGWMGNDFTQGTLAMIQYGFWYGAMAESDVNRGEVIMLPGPTWAGVRRNPTLAATGMIMSAATQVPDAAWVVFEWFNGGQPSIDRAQSGWGVPALLSQMSLIPNSTEYEQQKLRVLQDDLALATPPVQFNPFLGETTTGDTWNAQMNRALTGEITFDEMIANVESEVNAAIQDGINRTM